MQLLFKLKALSLISDSKPLKLRKMLLATRASLPVSRAPSLSSLVRRRKHSFLNAFPDQIFEEEVVGAEAEVDEVEEVAEVDEVDLNAKRIDRFANANYKCHLTLLSMLFMFCQFFSF
jgi:hypothetical protein